MNDYKNNNNSVKSNKVSIEQLKSARIWLCWNSVERDGRKTKKPCSAFGSITGTNSEYSRTWVTFEEAKNAACANNYSGVGFVIPEGWVFLDIDHRPMDDPYVVKMLERFDSYAEKSVSGNGIHIYGKCDFSKIPTEMKDDKLKLHCNYYQKNPNNGTELYIGGLTNRFAVFTEDVIQDKPIKDCTEAVLETLEKEMLKKADKTSKASDGTALRAATTVKGTSVNANTVIQGLKSQKNGKKFFRLFEKGDISGYFSQSEADLALCNMIAFRTGPNPDLIDEVFRQSQLYRNKWEHEGYRNKWERDDYREITIEKAIEGCNGKFYKYNKLPSSVEKKITPTVPDFICFKDKTGKPYVDVPLLAQYVRDHLHYLLVRDNGKQGLLKYVYENGVYKLYADEMFKGCIKKFIEDYDPKLVRFKQVDEVFRHIITDCNYISQDELNAREDIINFRNGLLYVSAEELRLEPHDPQIYSTIQIPSNWTGERSDAPVFADYLKTLTDGDKDTARLLMQFIGVCLSNVKGCRMKKSLFLVGDGDTGKSQLKSLVEKLLGKGNFIGADLSEIEARFGTGVIYGTRLAGSSDMGFMTVGSLKTFKRLTGGDSVFAEFKGFQGFEFTYSGLLWFCMNRLPKFGGDDGKWVYDRIMVVNCHNVIPLERQDKELLDKMYDERQGIIYLAVRALQKVICNGSQSVV